MKPINISTSRTIFRWQPAAWLRVSGDDAATFLQGQFTNELRGLARGDAVYGLWLSVKGKVLADSFVLRGAGQSEFWIGSYFSTAITIRERLESHIIADDVMVEDVTEAWSAVTLLDGRNPGTAREGFAFRGRRGEGDAIEWVFPKSEGEVIGRDLEGAVELDGTEMNRCRIEAGIPAVPSDVGPTDLPNEGGLETDAISFTKGCYLGQEVMARLKSMGQVRRKLLRVRGTGADFPVLPAPVFAGTRQVGELRSAVRVEDGFIGLAMLSLLHVKAGATLAFAPEAKPSLTLLHSP